ncbi:hypothetical protein QNA24_12315 [Rhodococcus qingshengii]|uniref:hypothetical protein n=1 Tax=Rhodococcus qingshengii TaxID=334542 RepID=UPI0024BB76EE|nr:hypothetical protein [Rhodococcus qingshengii]MDJ0487144.1 hypothetical protein [Rhodococcus qingshengii]
MTTPQPSVNRRRVALQILSVAGAVLVIGIGVKWATYDPDELSTVASTTTSSTAPIMTSIALAAPETEPVVIAPRTTSAGLTLGASDMIGARKLVEKTCKEAVTKQLKSPSSAEWSGVETTNTDTAGTEWVVVGDVDSQNGFGAMLRNSFGCTATYDIAKESTVVRVEFVG